jgi:hypothetical protein
MGEGERRRRREKKINKKLAPLGGCGRREIFSTPISKENGT